MKYEFLDAAETELRDAIAWYDARRAGLGPEFFEEIELVVDRVLAAPDQYPHDLTYRGTADVRNALLKRFSYQLIFVLRSDRVLFVAVAHERRKPGYWHGRIVEDS